MKQSSYKYKESRVVWLGDIPDHWELKKVKHIARFYTGWTPPSGNEEYYDGEYPWANISDLGTKYLRIPVRTITQEAVDSLRMKLSNTGSLLFSFKLSIGLVSLLKNDMYTNEAIATFPPNNKIKTSFLYYIAPVAIPMNAGVNIYNAPMLNQESIKNALLVYPPLDEQQAIASFLDREMARIDSLIQKKERMIELLKEKRIALITQAVTKGLDPNAKMKDSGIEWLGEVPEHWEVKRFVYACILQRGFDLPNDSFVEGEYPVMGSNGVIGYHDSFTTKAPSVTVGRSGSVGKVNYVASDFWAHNTALFVLSNKNNFVKWLYYLLLNIDMDSVSEGSAVPTLNRNNIHRLMIANPPLFEQSAIAEKLDKQMLYIGKLSDCIRDSIALLHEYRSSLIHHAVTGKIDLRDYHEKL